MRLVVGGGGGGPDRLRQGDWQRRGGHLLSGQCGGGPASSGGRARVSSATRNGTHLVLSGELAGPPLKLCGEIRMQIVGRLERVRGGIVASPLDLVLAPAPLHNRLRLTVARPTAAV